MYKRQDIEKVFNLVKSLEQTVAKEGETSPYLKSIAEKAEMLAQLFQNRQKSTQETLNELRKIVEEINTAKKEQAEKNMSTEIFSIYWLLEDVYKRQLSCWWIATNWKVSFLAISPPWA